MYIKYIVTYIAIHRYIHRYNSKICMAYVCTYVYVVA